MNIIGTKRFFFALRQAARKTVAQPRDAVLSARMALWVLVISVLAKLTSLPNAQKIAAFKVRSISLENNVETPARLGRTIDSLLGIDLFVFRRSCWKRALVLHRYLALNGIESQIRFGLKKESNGKVDGHAWIEHDGQPLLENNAASYVITFSLPVEHSSLRQSTSY